MKSKLSFEVYWKLTLFGGYAMEPYNWIRSNNQTSGRTWTLKEADIRKRLSFESKILKKIFGPNKNADGSWLIKTNNELEKIIKNRT
ncbi:hypothetical protein C0J52_21830 [Blattella germanica]|nr:hypothetical protein C0J52_21830 [Blattella germanica]